MSDYPGNHHAVGKPKDGPPPSYPSQSVYDAGPVSSYGGSQGYQQYPPQPPPGTYYPPQQPQQMYYPPQGHPQQGYYGQPQMHMMPPNTRKPSGGAGAAAAAAASTGFLAACCTAMACCCCLDCIF